LTTLDRLRHGFQRFVGRTIDDVAVDVGKAPTIGKSYAASVVRSAIKTVSPVAAEQLRDSAPTIKMSRVNDESYPYEALSFPAFKHVELVNEDWEDSDLLARIEQMLIVPVRGRTRMTPQGECIVGEPLFWRPSKEQLDTIEREWTMFRDLISEGRADDLPKESETVAIHVRPHGRDASDVDPTPGGGQQTRKSFWLNKRFVHELLSRGRTPNPSAPPRQA
jgi:DNA mismatch repair protein MutH